MSDKNSGNKKAPVPWHMEGLQGARMVDPIKDFVKRIPQPRLQSPPNRGSPLFKGHSLPPTRPPDSEPEQGGVGGFTENFILVKVPGKLCGDNQQAMWVPAQRKELYQLEMTKKTVDENLAKIFLSIAELELKAIFKNPESIESNRRLPRVGRNALIIAVFGQSSYGTFEIEKDPAEIGKIMKQSLTNVILRKREASLDAESAESVMTGASDCATIGSSTVGSELTEAGSILPLPPICETKRPLDDENRPIFDPTRHHDSKSSEEVSSETEEEVEVSDNETYLGDYVSVE